MAIPTRAYAFNEGSGTTAAEAGGGSSLTGVPAWATGRQGSSVRLNLVNGPTIPAFASNTAFTIMFDVYLDAAAGNGSTNMLINGTIGQIGILQQGYLNTLEWYPWLGPSGVEAPLSTWTNVAVVASGTTRRIVVNGVTASSVANTELSGTNTYNLGGQAGYEPNIRIDNFRAFNVALSDAEIAALAGTEVTAPPLEANIADNVGITDVPSVSSSAMFAYIDDAFGITDTGSPQVTTVSETRDDAVGMTDSVLAYLGAPNVKPVANAGPDRSVVPGEVVTLNGSGSTDSDGTIVSYTWAQTAGNGPLPLSGTGATRTFTAGVTGTFVFGLIVTDDKGESSPQDTVTITVTNTETALRNNGYVPYIIVRL